jgi:hypothetical protein
LTLVELTFAPAERFAGFLLGFGVVGFLLLVELEGAGGAARTAVSRTTPTNNVTQKFVEILTKLN